MRLCPVCPVCFTHPANGHLLCEACRKSYHRDTLSGDDTRYADIVWAAKRARWFERRRKKR